MTENNPPTPYELMKDLRTVVEKNKLHSEINGDSGYYHKAQLNILDDLEKILKEYGYDK